MFSRYFWTFVTTPSVEMTKGHIDMLSFHTFFIFQGQVFIYRNFLCLGFWECYVPKELLYLLQVLFYSVYRCALYRFC